MTNNVSGEIFERSGEIAATRHEKTRKIQLDLDLPGHTALDFTSHQFEGNRLDQFCCPTRTNAQRAGLKFCSEF